MYKEKINNLKKSVSMFDIVNGLILTLIAFVMLYPLYFTVIASISDPYAVASGEVLLLPKGFSLDSYREMIKNDDIWVGYKNGLVYTIVGTLFSLFLTIPAAYAMSKKYLWKRSFIATFFLVTMYFSGGLLPTYLVVKNIDLLNKPYTLIILGSFSAYNMIVARTYFQTSIPESLYEAAEIEGCSEFGKFFWIALPLAKPIVAVITLYYAVGRWNDFFNSLVYVTKPKYYSLQMVLRNILLENQTATAGIDATSMNTEQMAYLMQKAYMAESMKYSIIFISSLPMLIAYPFVQKYFVRGVMVGSVKE